MAAGRMPAAARATARRSVVAPLDLQDEGKEELEQRHSSVKLEAPSASQTRRTGSGSMG